MQQYMRRCSVNSHPINFRQNLQDSPAANSSSTSVPRSINYKGISEGKHDHTHRTLYPEEIYQNKHWLGPALIPPPYMRRFHRYRVSFLH